MVKKTTTSVDAAHRNVVSEQTVKIVVESVTTKENISMSKEKKISTSSFKIEKNIISFNDCLLQISNISVWSRFRKRSLSCGL